MGKEMLIITQFLSYQIIARKDMGYVKKYPNREDFKRRMGDNKVSYLSPMSQAFSRLII